MNPSPTWTKSKPFPGNKRPQRRNSTTASNGLRDICVKVQDIRRIFLDGSLQVSQMYKVENARQKRYRMKAPGKKGESLKSIVHELEQTYAECEGKN